MYAKKIEMIDVEIKALKEKRNSVLNEWVNKHHPCEIGAKVETSGCSYDGKQMSVQRRSIRQGLKGTWVWCATGPIFKVNGKLGVNIGEWEAVL